MGLNKMNFEIETIKPADFKRIYKHIKKDFSAGEYAPYFVLHMQIINGIQQGFLLFSDGREAAYSVCAGGNPNGFALISLLAVYPEYRGAGIGTAFVEEIKKMYADKKGIIVEVEKPENAANDTEKSKRDKRMDFYQRAGFEIIPGIAYSIWGVPMHLMVYPGGQTAPGDVGRVIYEIYLELMGKRFIHMLKFRQL